jgi:hypothetical protein
MGRKQGALARFQYMVDLPVDNASLFSCNNVSSLLQLAICQFIVDITIFGIPDPAQVESGQQDLKRFHLASIA